MNGFVHILMGSAPDGAGDVADVFEVLGWCCEGSALRGPTYCTCWEPIFDQDQETASVGEVAGLQPAECHDCAYRAGAPEDRYDMDELVARGRPFWCHYGMRRVIGFTHPQLPADFVLPAGPGDYRPLIVVDDITGQPVPFQADGTPGRLCAGWTKRRIKAMSR